MSVRQGSWLTIGKLSELTEVHRETIRYYERVGLIETPRRTEGGHRVFDAEQAMRLTFVRRARELGFSLSDIRAMFRMMAGDHSCGEMRDLALAHAAEIRDKIDVLIKMERLLTDTAAKCRGDKAPDCPIADALFDRATGRRDGP